MTPNAQKIRFFRSRIPAFECVPGCHDCCGPVTASSEEVVRLPEKSAAEHQAALENYSCPYLGAKGCEVYGERPLICRVFGTTPKLTCPRGCAPQQMLDKAVETEIFRFLRQTRQVLL